MRDGAWVAELTGLLNLATWPAGMRVIVRKERPHPGAQLRLTDIDGHRYTAFATNTATGQLADLELRHRRRARAEDRSRTSKDTGLTNLNPLGKTEVCGSHRTVTEEGRISRRRREGQCRSIRNIRRNTVTRR